MLIGRLRVAPMARIQRRLPKSNRLSIEALEDRALPSAAAPLELAGLDGANCSAIQSLTTTGVPRAPPGA
jgi:hypothetical protein